MRIVERILTVTLMFVLGAVYASAQQPSALPAAVTDIQKYAGKWSGWGTAASGSAFPITADVKPDGTYTTMMGTTSGQGRFKAVDCKITGITTEGHLGGPGGAGAAGMSQAWIGAEGGKLVLSGIGRNDGGPFNYVLTKQ